MNYRNLKVHLFIPCLVDQFFPETGLAMARILEKIGVQLYYPEEQTCCGQPAFNTGYRKETAFLAGHFLNIFNEADYIVAPSGSCVSMVRTHYKDLNLSDRDAARLGEIIPKIFEFTEFLVDFLKITDLNCEYSGAVTYHDSCHSNRELGIKQQPRELLKKVRGLDFREMPESERCCGFGGTFSVKFAELSEAMVKEKCKTIFQTGADLVLSNDNSCLMNIGGYLQRQGTGVRVAHIADFLYDTMKEK